MAPNYQSGRAKIKALKNHTGKISSLEDKGRKNVYVEYTVGPIFQQGIPNI